MVEPEFVKELELINKCPQCKGVLRDPIQLMCGHLVCNNTCLENLFAGDTEIVCNYENCGMLIQKSQVSVLS